MFTRDFRSWSAERDVPNAAGSNNNNARFTSHAGAQQPGGRPPNNYAGNWNQSATLPRQWGGDNRMGGPGGWDGFGAGARGGRYETVFLVYTLSIV